MSSTAKIWLIVSILIIVLGAIFFVGGMTVMKWDFGKLTTAKYEEHSYEITDAFDEISILTNTADIVFLPSEDAKTKVHCLEEKGVNHAVSVKDGVLSIEAEDTRKWYEHIHIGFKAPRIAVYLPAGEYGALAIKSNTGNVEIPQGFTFASIAVEENTGDVCLAASSTGAVKIHTSTGHISITGAGAGALDLKVSTGKIALSDVACQQTIAIKVSTGRSALTNVTCADLESSGSTGDLTMKDLRVQGTLTVHRSTGDVCFEGVDAGELFVETGTGDVRGTLRSEKVFIARTDTGKIDVPRTVTGGRCEITTSTGDIRITIAE